MAGIVVTVVADRAGGLDQALLARMKAFAEKHGAEVTAVKTLAAGKAVDIYAKGPAATLLPVLRRAMPDIENADVFVQENTANRRKKILFCDMDATLVENETIDDLARLSGVADQVAEMTAQALAGKTGFAASFLARLSLLAGVDVALLDRVYTNIHYAAGARTMLDTLRRHGVTTVLVSGGIAALVSRVATDCGFDHAYGNMIDVIDGKIAGTVKGNVIDSAGKRSVLENMCKAQGVDPADTVAVGDGANDIDMLTAAGTGIACFPKPALAAVADHQIKNTCLESVLYIQGYTEADITRV